ncbi:transketolase C-terminal domain-containing protein [Streptomyces sp900105245]|uniref:Transketolase C-terminal domain-containing protein n=1 Tax=Streptomyces sp. 900105245 TaxID=3154379 RepID=A0ABV1UKQ2_9ACTN
MRPAVAQMLADLGGRLSNLVVMAADGHALGALFADRFPERFIDVGIAEANLVSVASGLARGGYKVVVGTMAPFLLRRAFEQIRLDVCHPGLDVTFLGVGGGLAYGSLGATHHIVDDLGLMAAMPDCHVFAPVDVHDARWAVEEAVNRAGPAYVRLGARDDEIVYHGRENFSCDEPLSFGEAGEHLVIAMGATVPEALRAATEAKATGNRVQVLALAGLSPFPAQAVRRAARTASSVTSVEEHDPASGLGARTAIELAGWWHGNFTALGIDSRPGPTADRAELFRFHGIDSRALARVLDRK